MQLQSLADVNTYSLKQADLEDKESLKSVLAGAYALFLVTSFWDKMDAALEEQQGKNVADVAKVRSEIFPKESIVMGTY